MGSVARAMICIDGARSFAVSTTKTFSVSLSSTVMSILALLSPACRSISSLVQSPTTTSHP